MSPLEIRRRNAYQLGDETPTGQVLRESVAASEVLERAAEAAEFEGVHARTSRDRARRAGSGSLPGGSLRTGKRPGRVRDRPRARRGTVPGSRAPARSSSRPWRRSSWATTASDPDPDRLDRDGAGDEDDLPPARGGGARAPVRGRRDRAAGHRDRAGLGADGREPHGDGRRRAADPGRAAPEGRGRGAQRRQAVRRRLPLGLASSTARPGSTSSSSRIRASSSTTRRTAATHTRPSAGRPASPRSMSTSTPAR